MGSYVREYRYRKAERDLRAFVEQGWPVVEPNTPYVPTWHIDAICDHLMAVTMGWLLYLIINIPPRHTKTRVVCTYHPAWEWIQWPHITSLYTGIKLDNVLSESVDSRRLIQSDWYQSRWGDRFALTGDQNTKGYYENDQGGSRRSLSLLVDPVGKGADKVVVDDPNGLDDALNQAALDRAWAKWQSYSTRRNDPRRGSFVIIQQRVHDADVSGRIMQDRLRTHQDWTVLSLPAEFDPKRICILTGTRARPVEMDAPDAEPSPWGPQRKPVACAYARRDFRDPRDTEGEPLNPERFPVEVLQAQRETDGTWKYEAQFNQNVVPREGALFPRARWRRFQKPPLSEDGKRMAFDELVQSWDCAFKDLATSDYVAGGVLGRKGPNVYILEIVRGRWSASKTIQQIEAMTARWPSAVLKLVEDKANGPAVVDMLASKLPGLVLVNPEGGKEARAAATEPFHEAGNLWIPDEVNGCHLPRTAKQGVVWEPLNTSWVEPFLFELERFPKGVNDDQVDVLTQAVTRWISKLQAARPQLAIASVSTGRSAWAGPR